MPELPDDDEDYVPVPVEEIVERAENKENNAD